MILLELSHEVISTRLLKEQLNMDYRDYPFHFDEKQAHHNQMEKKHLSAECNA